MAKFRVLFPFSGWINGQEWPAVGEEIDLPEKAAESMVEAGHLEPVKAAKKTAAKKADSSEKRPASDENVEKR